MKNLFKRRKSKNEVESLNPKPKTGIERDFTSIETDHNLLAQEPAEGEFLDTDEDLGYC